MLKVLKTALQEKDVTFEVTAEMDDLPVRGNALASGDDEADRECEDEIIRRLNQGDVWAWACVKVTARFGEHEAHDYLGACSYADENDFRACAYFTDMKAEVLAQLNRSMTRRLIRAQRSIASRAAYLEKAQ
jgi:hypothetical protein